MSKNAIKYTIVLFITILAVGNSYSQDFFNGFNVGAKVGSSKLLGEMESVFGEHVNEFNNSYGLAYDIEISKYLGNNWDVGIEIGSSKLLGETDNPQFSAEGYHHSMPEPIEDPVEYENALLSQKIFMSYYFRQINSESGGAYINPFLRAGIGNLIYRAKLQYKDPSDGGIIFSKGVNQYDNIKLTTVVFFLSGGIKASLIGNLNLLASANLNYVNYDFLDAVYNYTPTGERSYLSALYAEFKIGLSYSFGEYAGSGKKKRGRKGKVTSSHQPFAPVK